MIGQGDTHASEVRGRHALAESLLLALQSQLDLARLADLVAHARATELAVGGPVDRTRAD